MARLVAILCVVGLLYALTRTSEGIPMRSNYDQLSREGFQHPFQRLNNGRATRYVPKPSCQPIGRTCGRYSGECCGNLDCMEDFKDSEGVCW